MNKITILGSGDTLGPPAIGCTRPASIDAKVNSKSKRTRFGMYIQLDGVNILIDPNPDIDQQLDMKLMKPSATAQRLSPTCVINVHD